MKARKTGAHPVCKRCFRLICSIPKREQYEIYKPYCTRNCCERASIEKVTS